MHMYTVEEITSVIAPVARSYGLKEVWLFGSYARGDAREDSDIDLLFVREGSRVTSLLKASAMYADISSLFSVPVDLVSADELFGSRNREKSYVMIENIDRDKVKIYDREGEADIA